MLFSEQLVAIVTRIIVVAIASRLPVRPVYHEELLL